jgi:hypothetical protein
MQEQRNDFSKESGDASSAKRQEREIISFHEVRYSPFHTWKPLLQRVTSAYQGLRRFMGMLFGFIANIGQNPILQSLVVMDNTLQYFMGLAIGCIPLLLFFISIGRFQVGVTSSSDLTTIALYSYLALWIVAAVCVCISRIRFIGYGLLTMAIISPVIWYISCVASFHGCYRRAC